MSKHKNFKITLFDSESRPVTINVLREYPSLRSRAGISRVPAKQTYSTNEGHEVVTEDEQNFLVCETSKVLTKKPPASSEGTKEP